MACITLLSDFGLHDASVAVAHGVLMQHASELPVIDISHEVTPYLTTQAAYLLASAWSSFPPGTVHVVLFDIFYNTAPRLVLSQHKSHYFLTPDNGVLPAALGTMPERSWLCMELTGADSFTHWLHTAGRIIAMLTSANQPANESTYQLITAEGLPQYTLQKAAPPPPPTTGDMAECEVIHIDRYENVVTNITRQQFEALRNGRRFRLQFMMTEEITEISQHYHDVREGYKLCRFNSSGYLEICINRGHAASLFGLRPGSRHNDIKIYFE